jgi:hypothetical protein
MFTLVRHVGLRKSLEAEALPLIVALAITEVFCHFHSFILECSAFVVAWCALSSLQALLKRLFER